MATDEEKVGRNGYIEGRSGQLPLVVSVPHGGTWDPPTMPDRTWGRVIPDGHTLDLAFDIVEHLEKKTGRRPFLVFSNLLRSKLDPNREIDEGAQGCPSAEVAWAEYHRFIEEARDAVTRSWGGGLLLDIHGHAHSEARIELGYGVGRRALEAPDAGLDAGRHADTSSIRELARRHPDEFSRILRGPDSLGGLLERAGWPVTPGPTHPHPGGGSYFSGGYIVGRHGSRDGGTVSAVQLEHPKPGVRDRVANRVRYAADLGDALVSFLGRYYPPGIV